MYTQGAIIFRITQLNSTRINPIIPFTILFFTSPVSEPVESIIPFITINKTQARAAIAVTHFIIFQIIHCTLLNPGSILHSYKPAHVPDWIRLQFQPGILSVTFTVIAVVQVDAVVVGAGGPTKSGLEGSQTPPANEFCHIQIDNMQQRNRVIFFIFYIKMIMFLNQEGMYKFLKV